MLDATTIQTIEFSLNRYGDLDDKTERTLRVLRNEDGLTVVDGMTPRDWEPVQVYLLGCGSEVLGAFPNYKNESYDLATVASNILTDHGTFCDEIDEWVYPDGTFLIRVDFDLEDGSIEAARDVTEDAGLIFDI